jgi:hypothetical protein
LAGRDDPLDPEALSREQLREELLVCLTRKVVEEIDHSSTVARGRRSSQLSQISAETRKPWNVGCFLPFLEVVMADSTGRAAPRDTCLIKLKTCIAERRSSPAVNAQERSREELLASLRTILTEALEFNRQEARAAAESGFEEETLSV